MEEEIIAYVSAETPLMSDPASWLVLAFTGSPLITLLSLKIWVRMIRFQTKKSTACEYWVQTTVCRLNCCRTGAPTFSSLLNLQNPRALKENHRANPSGRHLWNSLAQASAQSRASSKIWSGCPGPFSINVWKSLETAQLFWVILSRVWTQALWKKKIVLFSWNFSRCRLWLLFCTLPLCTKGSVGRGLYRKHGSTQAAVTINCTCP